MKKSHYHKVNGFYVNIRFIHSRKGRKKKKGLKKKKKKRENENDRELLNSCTDIGEGVQMNFHHLIQ